MLEINVNELRLGNYVGIAEFMNFKVAKVTNIKENRLLVETKTLIYSSNNHKIIPFKLTEDIAIKLDFKKDNSENNKTYLSPKVNGSRMKIYFNRFGVAKFTMNMFHQIEIENVHTLQNLFFALYGSELVSSTEP